MVNVLLYRFQFTSQYSFLARLFCDQGYEEKMFYEAMEKGFVTSKDLVIVLIGIAGSGKSSFKRVALNLPPEEIRKSTPLAEAVIRNISISRAMALLVIQIPLNGR